MKHDLKNYYYYTMVKFYIGIAKVMRKFCVFLNHCYYERCKKQCNTRGYCDMKDVKEAKFWYDFAVEINQSIVEWENQLNSIW